MGSNLALGSKVTLILYGAELALKSYVCNWEMLLDPVLLLEVQVVVVVAKSAFL